MTIIIYEKQCIYKKKRCPKAPLFGKKITNMKEYYNVAIADIYPDISADPNLIRPASYTPPTPSPELKPYTMQ